MIGLTSIDINNINDSVDSSSYVYCNSTNSSGNVTSVAEPASLNLVHAVLTGVILSAISFMTICGNVLVLLAVFVNSHLRSTTNYFIVNLAIADLLLGTTVLPFSAVLEVIPYWPFGSFFCDIWAAMDVLCCTASILSLCVISIDRYIGVTRPLQHSTILTEKRAFYIIIVIWALSVIISVAPLLGWKEPPHPDPTVCQVTKQLGYVLFSVSGSFYIPLIIILVVYFRVYREALSQSRFLSTGIKTSKTTESNCEVTLRIHKGKRPSNNASANNSANPYQSSSSSEHSEGSHKKTHSRMTLAGKVAKFKREKKAAKTLGIVVGVFIMCWFPFFFILPLESLCTRCYIPELLFKIIFWLGYCNSMMNPIIYACSSKEFKRAFLRILRCRFRRRPRSFVDERFSSSSGTEMNKLLRIKTERGNKRKWKDTVVSESNSSRICNNNRFLRQATNGKRRVEQSPLAALKFLQDRNEHTMDALVISDDDSDDVQFEYSDEEMNEPSQGGGSEVTTMEASPLRTAHAPDHDEERKDSDMDDIVSKHEDDKQNIRNYISRPHSQELENTCRIPNIVVDTSFAEPIPGKSDSLTIRNGFADTDIRNKISSDKSNSTYSLSKEDSIMWL